MELLGLISTMVTILGQVKGLFAEDKASIERKQTQDEFHHLWSTIEGITSQIDAEIHLIIQNQNQLQKENIDTFLKLQKMQQHMRVMELRMTELDQHIAQTSVVTMAPAIVEFIDAASQPLNRYLLPSPSPEPVISTNPIPEKVKEQEDIVKIEDSRTYQFTSSPKNDPLPSTNSYDSGRILSVYLRQQLTFGPTFYSCPELYVHQGHQFFGFYWQGDPRLHILAIQGDDPQSVDLWYLRANPLDWQMPSSLAEWNSQLSHFAIQFHSPNSPFIVISGKGIHDLVARLNRGEFDTQFS